MNVIKQELFNRYTEKLMREKDALDHLYNTYKLLETSPLKDTLDLRLHDVRHNILLGVAHTFNRNDFNVFFDDGVEYTDKDILNKFLMIAMLHTCKFDPDIDDYYKLIDGMFNNEFDYVEFANNVIGPTTINVINMPNISNPNVVERFSMELFSTAAKIGASLEYFAKYEINVTIDNMKSDPVTVDIKLI